MVEIIENVQISLNNDIVDEFFLGHKLDQISNPFFILNDK